MASKDAPIRHATPEPVLSRTDCIQKNNYNEARCQKQIDALYECCDAFYKQQGDDASVVSCPKVSLLRLKMKQRAQGKQ
ncbi:hypothetical protein BLS_003304 [Venturia inaequalis]|uniref:Cx9C motif-containing protein 4, mitochondrial n=1 Tax=Venturia inaequalis TaxID=5025 RepID=A0A8H3YW30_VENIN|nr:hypothetical protein BLS_003304 [Venturia inaequalis]